MKISRAILTKILSVCILLILVIPADINAISRSELNANFHIFIDLANGGKSKAIYNIDLKNNGNRFIDEYTLEVPFRKVSSQKVSINGRPMPVTKSSSRSGTTVIDMQLRQLAIRPGKSARIQVSFTANNPVISSGKYSLLYIPRVAANYQVEEIKYTITNYAKFGGALYLSHPDISEIPSGAIVGATLTDLNIIWGEDYQKLEVDLSSRYDDSGSYVSRLLLPNSFKSQRIRFPYFEHLDNFGLSEYNQLWAYIKSDERPQILAEIEIDEDIPSEYPFSTPDQCKLDVDLEDQFGLSSEMTPAEIVEVISSKTGFVPVELKKRFSKEQVINSLSIEPYNLTNLESNCVASSALTKLGYSNQIVYGYYAIDFIPGLDVLRPYSWIWVEGEDYLLDNVITRISGYDNFKFPRSFYLIYGSYSNGLSFEDLLGLGGGSELLPRADIVARNIEIDSVTDQELNLSVSFPSKVLSGEFYSGSINIHNPNSVPVQIESVRVLGEDFTNYVKSLTADTERLLRPGDNLIEFHYLREPNFFYEGEKDHQVVVETDGLESVRSNLRITYERDHRIIVAVFVIIGVIVFVLIYKLVAMIQLSIKSEQKGKAWAYGKKIARVEQKKKDVQRDTAIKVDDIIDL